MSDGAKHFDATTQAGLEAIAWWDRMSESERIALLAEAHTNEPAIARLHWLRNQERSTAQCEGCKRLVTLGDKAINDQEKLIQGLESELAECLQVLNQIVYGKASAHIPIGVAKIAERLINKNVAATETEPSPVSPPVSRSVAAALLASLESILCFLEPDSVSDQCDDARLREEFAAIVERAHEAVANAKAGGL